MNAQIFDAEQYGALTQQIHQLRADAQQRIQSIRDAIRQLTDELRVVSRSICLEDAAAKIEASFIFGDSGNVLFTLWATAAHLHIAPRKEWSYYESLG